MVQDVLSTYGWVGEVAVVVAFLGFMALLSQLVLERHSPRWARAAQLPLEDSDEVTR